MADDEYTKLIVAWRDVRLTIQSLGLPWVSQNVTSRKSHGGAIENILTIPANRKTTSFV